MVNVVPVHKRDDKQNVNNHRPVSLLRIFGKIFGRLIDNKINTWYLAIFKSRLRGVFLDTSKAFNKVGYKGLIHKSEQNGSGGSLLKILTDYLK